MSNSTVNTTAVLTDTRGMRAPLLVRIVDMDRSASAPVDHWLSPLKVIGLSAEATFTGPLLPKLVLRPGILVRLAIPEAVIGAALEAYASGEAAHVMRFTTDVLRPMNEPCVRVPITLLRELRGFEARSEYARRALVDACNEFKPLPTAKGRDS